MQPGDVASYSCDTLYTLQGAEHRICLRNGTWSGMEPECVGKYIMFGLIANKWLISTIDLQAVIENYL